MKLHNVVFDGIRFFLVHVMDYLTCTMCTLYTTGVSHGNRTTDRFFFSRSFSKRRRKRRGEKMYLFSFLCQEPRTWTLPRVYGTAVVLMPHAFCPSYRKSHVRLWTRHRIRVDRPRPFCKRTEVKNNRPRLHRQAASVYATSVQYTKSTFDRLHERVTE